MKKILNNKTAKVSTTIRIPLGIRNKIYKKLKNTDITFTSLVISLLSEDKFTKKAILGLQKSLQNE